MNRVDYEKMGLNSVKVEEIMNEFIGRIPKNVIFNVCKEFDSINNGYNQKLNRDHVESKEDINLNSFSLTAKYVYNSKFTVGGLSRYLDYEKCLKLENMIPSRAILKSKMIING